MNAEEAMIFKNWLILPLAGAVQASITYLHLNAEQLTILSILIAIDIVTGVIKAYIVSKNVTSHRFLLGFLSKVVLLGIPFILALGAKGVGFDVEGFVALCVSVLVVGEVYSSIGNIYTITTKKEVTEIDAVSAILGMIRELLERLINKNRE